MRIEDEPDLCFITIDGEEQCYDIKMLLVLLGKEQCPDDVYDARKAICDSCEHLKREMCDVDRQPIRLENRFADKKCPLNKW